jgi:hypothetical protein
MSYHRSPTYFAASLLAASLGLIGCQTATAPRSRIAPEAVSVNVDQDVAVRVDNSGNVYVRTPDGRVSVRPVETLANQSALQQPK